MSGPVLVPLDGSPLAERALPYALTLARREHLEILLVRILQSTAPRGQHLVQEPEAQAALEHLAQELRGQEVEAETLVSSTLLGTVASRILDIADRHACTAIVMSTHGLSGPGRWLHGSVAEELLRHSRRPVVLISSVCDSRWTDATPFRVLVPLDGSALAESIVEPTLASTGMDSELILLTVLPPLNAEAAANMLEDVDREEVDARASLGRMADQLARDGVRARVQIARGGTAATIAQIAREQDIDLIAMATHGRTGLTRLVFGSVATETLQRSPVPVLLLRPNALAAAHGEPSTETAASAGPLTILVALDLTDKANAALAPAARLARASRGHVILLNAFWPPVDAEHVVAQTRAEGVEYARAERQMYLLEKARAFHGVDVTTRVEVQPHEEEVDECIARVAQEVRADVLIVVSKRVASATGVVLGSFARGLLRLSPCPVLVVRPDPATTRHRIAAPTHVQRRSPSGASARR